MIENHPEKGLSLFGAVLRAGITAFLLSLDCRADTIVSIQPEAGTWNPTPIQLAADIQSHLNCLDSLPLPANTPPSQLEADPLHAQAAVRTLHNRLMSPETDPGRIYAGMVLLQAWAQSERLVRVKEYLKTAQTTEQPALGQAVVAGMERWASALQKDPQARNSLANVLSSLQKAPAADRGFDQEALESKLREFFDGTLLRGQEAETAQGLATVAGSSQKTARPFAELNQHDPAAAADVRFKDIPSPVNDEGFPLKPGKAPEFDPSIQQSAQTIERRLFAVHATKFIPTNGIIQAKTASLGKGELTLGFETPSFRPTIHFALGELVRDHDGFSWKDCPYALLMPVGALKNQLINLNTYDTFILGDLRLPKEAILMMPYADVSLAPAGAHVEAYDSREETLRTAVDRIIARYGGWKIQMKEKTPNPDSKGMIGDRNINTPDFFNAFLKANPRISFGTHLRSEVGNAFRIGGIDVAIDWLIAAYTERDMVKGTHELLFYSRFIRRHLERLEKELSSMNFPEDSMRAFNEKRGEVLEWLNLAEADIRLREGYGRTLQRADKGIRIEAAKLRADSKALERYLMPHLNKLPRVGGQNVLYPSLIAEFLYGTPPEEMQELTQNMVKDGSLDKKGLATLRLQYALQRAILRGLARSREEGSWDLLEQNLAILELNGRGEGFKEFMESLEPYLDERSTKLDTALRILESGKIKAGLETRYGFRFPRSPLTLQDFLLLHPDTREAFKTPPPPPPSQALTIVGKLLSMDAPQMKRLSFEEAKFSARRMKEDRALLDKDLKTVARPMRTIRDIKKIGWGEPMTFYECLQRGDYGTLDKVWEKLGLQKEFRTAYPKDEDFWRSNASMLQIHELLTRMKR
ncbi:MAG: hypothetical protein WCU88_02130 [Elusimicrobiota bacterium]